MDHRYNGMNRSQVMQVRKLQKVDVFTHDTHQLYLLIQQNPNATDQELVEAMPHVKPGILLSSIRGLEEGGYIVGKTTGQAASSRANARTVYKYKVTKKDYVPKASTRKVAPNDKKAQKAIEKKNASVVLDPVLQDIPKLSPIVPAEVKTGFDFSKIPDERPVIEPVANAAQPKADDPQEINRFVAFIFNQEMDHFPEEVQVALGDLFAAAQPFEPSDPEEAMVLLLSAFQALPEDVKEVLGFFTMFREEEPPVMTDALTIVSPVQQGTVEDVVMDTSSVEVLTHLEKEILLTQIFPHGIPPGFSSTETAKEAKPESSAQAQATAEVMVAIEVGSNSFFCTGPEAKALYKRLKAMFE